MTKTRRRKSSKALRAVTPNAGIRAKYQKMLMELVKPMCKETLEELRMLYKTDAPLISQDELPASKFAAMIKSLRQRWDVRFSQLSSVISAWFVMKVGATVTRSQKSAMNSAGLGDFAVRYDFGNVKKDVAEALIQQNVSLIQSISSVYFQKIEATTMNALTAGGDLTILARELKDINGVTERRALMVANDQLIRATESIARANDIDAGFTKGEWIHIAGRYTSRKSHEAMNHKIFDIREGMYDSAVGRKVQTGELPNCRCKYRPLFDFEVAQMKDKENAKK